MPARKRLPDYFGRATQIFGEHVHLRSTAGRLQALCDEGKADEAAHLLPEFRRELLAHFSAEESDGYFGMLQIELPHLTESIAQLRVEHGIMLSELNALGALSGDELLSRIRALLVRFRAHERTENALLEDFFARD